MTGVAKIKEQMVFLKKNSGTVILFIVVASLSIIAAKKNVMHVIDQKVCTQCGDCIKACTENAITVSIVDGKKKHEIDPLKCTQCGDCIDACKEGAILVMAKKSEKSSAVKSK